MSSLIVQTAYMDLLQRFESRPGVSIPGSILSVEKSGRRFYVARRRIGDRVVEEAIGPVQPKIDENNKDCANKARWS